MIRVDIGDIVIKQKVKGLVKNKDKVFNLKPSFENISKIGDPSEIIEAYSTLLNNRHNELVVRFQYSANEHVINEIKAHVKNQGRIADLVIASCCDGEPPKLKTDTKISIAIALLQHGVSGVAKVRVSQRNQTKQKMTAFDINQYIMSARINLGLSFEEAKSLTMTEFILLMAAKYPDNDGLTSEEYDQAMSNYQKRKAERIRAAS